MYTKEHPYKKINAYPKRKSFAAPVALVGAAAAITFLNAAIDLTPTQAEEKAEQIQVVKTAEAADALVAKIGNWILIAGCVAFVCGIVMI